MGSDTLDIDGFLVRVTVKDASDRKFLHNLKRLHPEVFEDRLPHSSTDFIVKNTGLGLFVLDRLYKRFHPFCSVQALMPFNRWMLPKKVKEVSEERCRISKSVKRRLEEVKYAPKIIAISKSE